MLHYEVEETTLRIGKDKGQKRFQAKRIAQGRLTLSMVEEAIVQKTSLAKGDVRNAIISLAEVVNAALLAGNIVELGDLGSFQVQANGKMVKTEEEATARSVKKPQIRYNPRKAMRQYAQQVSINVRKRDGSTDTAGGSGDVPNAGGTPSVGGHSL